MAENKPRDFWRYPLGEEDLIRFDVPKEEKLLRDKLTHLQEEIEKCIQNISSDEMFNEIIANYQPRDQPAIQQFLYQSEVFWKGKRYSLSDWLKKGFQATQKIVKQEFFQSINVSDKQR